MKTNLLSGDFFDNENILNDFKVKMINNIISSWDDKKSIFWKFKKDSKKYYQEDFIKWKNYRDWEFFINSNNLNIIKSDLEKFIELFKKI